MIAITALRVPFYCGVTLILTSLSHNVVAGKTTLINMAPSPYGEQSDSASGDTAAPSISADGRYIAFSSTGSNIVTGDTNHVSNVFVYDRWSGKNKRVSVDATGKQANKPSGSFGPSLSADGAYVAFSSDATNLVTGDTNKVADIFIYNQATGKTERVNVASDGKQANGETTGSPQLNADGRYVAFVSTATNLVAQDTNGVADVFVHDRVTHKTERVSVSSSGKQSNNVSGEYGISLSVDGQYVVFSSDATNLVAKDTNKARDIFVHDRQTQKTERVSVSSTGVQGNASSSFASINANGTYIVFVSAASSLVAKDTNHADDVFLYDLKNKNTERVTRTLSGAQGNAASGATGVSVNATGRYIAFSSDAYNLSVERSGGLFMYDVVTHKTNWLGAQANLAASSLNADSRYIALSSDDANWVTEDTNGQSDIFVHDRLLDESHSADLTIIPATTNPSVLPANGQGVYTYLIGNRGPDGIRDVHLIYRISGGEVVQFTSTQERCPKAASETICYLSRLVAGTALQLTVTVKAKGGIVKQSLSANGEPIDAVPTNNVAVISTPAR